MVIQSIQSTHSTRAKERVTPSPKSLVKSGGIAATNMVAVKKESQLIAKNPKRFLESFSQGRGRRPEVSSLNTLIANMDSDFNAPAPQLGHWQGQGQGKEMRPPSASALRAGAVRGPRSDAALLAKAKSFDDKHKLSKSRTLLLNMSVPAGAGGAGRSIRGSGGVSNFFQNMTPASLSPSQNKKPIHRTYGASYHHKPGSLAASRERHRVKGQDPDPGQSSSHLQTTSSSAFTSRPRSRSMSRSSSPIPKYYEPLNSSSKTWNAKVRSNSTPGVGGVSGQNPQKPKKFRPLKNRVSFSDKNNNKPEPEWSQLRKMDNKEDEDTDEDEVGGYYDKDLDKNNVDEVEGAVTGFIDRIKHSDIDKIIIWINTLASMSDVQLPFGYPSHLSIPLDLEGIGSSELRSFAEGATDEFHLLDGEYSAKLEELGKRLEDNFASLQSSRWSPKDSALLFYIMTATSLEDGYGVTVAGLKDELLAKLFPRFNEEQIATQKYRLRMKRAWEEKRGAILKDWIRDREDLTTKINEGWNTLQEHLTKKEELAQSRRDQLARCAFWRGELDKLRKEKRAKIRRIQVIVEPFERALDDRARARLEEEARARRASHALLAEFRAQQEFSRQREHNEQQGLEAQLAANAKLQAHYNKSRVAARHVALEQKKAEALELTILKQEEAMIRVEMLERTKEKVVIDYHPSNILADTHSSLLHRVEIPESEHYLSPEEEEMVAFFRSRYAHSFSSERVLKDRRSRLENKLRDAGLINNSYARQVLQAMEPKPKPHLVSHINFKDQEQNYNKN